MKSAKKQTNRLRRRPRKTKAGTLLRSCREKKKMTLRDVEAATGLLSGGISHFENGRSIPTLKTAIVLCAFYKLPLTTLAKAVEDDEL
jgi:transcriptional regulator with XRE-family HTH domain